MTKKNATTKNAKTARAANIALTLHGQLSPEAVVAIEACLRQAPYYLANNEANEKVCREIAEFSAALREMVNDDDFMRIEDELGL